MFLRGGLFAHNLLRRAFAECDHVVNRIGATLQVIDQLRGRSLDGGIAAIGNGFFPGNSRILRFLLARARRGEDVGALGNVIKQFLVHGGSSFRIDFFRNQIISRPRSAPSTYLQVSARKGPRPRAAQPA